MKEIRTYDKPGRAMKRCDACGVYLHYSHPVCVCGHAFSGMEPKPVVEKPVVPKTVKVHASAGRALKHCDGCHGYVHYSVDKCACGYDFPVKPDVPKKIPVEVVKEKVVAPVSKVEVTPEVALSEQLPPLEYSDPGLHRVYIPARECPIKLKGTTVDEVADWAEAVRENFKERRMFLSSTGLKYYVRHFQKFPEHGPTHTVLSDGDRSLVLSHLDQLFG